MSPQNCGKKNPPRPSGGGGGGSKQPQGEGKVYCVFHHRYYYARDGGCTICKHKKVWEGRPKFGRKN